MQDTKNWKVKPITILLGSMFTLSVCAGEGNITDSNNGKAQPEKNESDAYCITCNIGGSISAGYSTNIYNKDDYRASRSFSWNGKLIYTLSENMGTYITSGGYRALDDAVGTYATDSTIGLSHSKLYEFGESGKIGASGQFIIPTSEASRNDKLQTAFRLAVPISFEYWGVNFNISPRLRKNFHKYKTYGGKSLTEWTYSLFTDASITGKNSLWGLTPWAEIPQVIKGLDAVQSNMVDLSTERMALTITGHLRSVQKRQVHMQMQSEAHWVISIYLIQTKLLTK